MTPTETPARGRFIVFEGLDGSGTTTQVSRLTQRLSDIGVSVETTKEPSNGPVGAALRQAIDGRVHLHPIALALAFAADRADHLLNDHNGVMKLVDAGHWVLCDRYVLSSLAYQAGDNVEQRWLQEVNSFATAPDLTVFLDADPDTCMRRISARSSTDELFHTNDHLTRALTNYHQVITHAGIVGELLIIDANGSIDEVSEAVWQGVSERLLRREAHTNNGRARHTAAGPARNR